MANISFCSTCKGRLWQLKETLPSNLAAIRDTDNIEIVLLDYHSNDGLKDYIFRSYAEELFLGKLKYFELITPKTYFDMSYAKNVAHCLATGSILFNLDADNLIGDTVRELSSLPHNSILIPRMATAPDLGRLGRIGIHADKFHLLRGYSEHIRGMGGDDADFIYRATLAGLKPQYSDDFSQAIPNSFEEKHLFVDPATIGKQRTYKSVNSRGYGNAVVKDHHGIARLVGFSKKHKSIKSPLDLD